MKFIIIAHVKSIQIRSYFWSVFSPNIGKYGPEITLYLDVFHAVRPVKNENSTICKLGYQLKKVPEMHTFAYKYEEIDWLYEKDLLNRQYKLTATFSCRSCLNSLYVVVKTWLEGGEDIFLSQSRDKIGKDFRNNKQ